MADKYLVFAARNENIDAMSFVVFNEHLTHYDMAQALLPCVTEQYSAPVATVVGAGFIEIDECGQYKCYGKSESLNIASRMQHDSQVLNWFGSTFIMDSEENDELAKQFPYSS